MQKHLLYINLFTITSALALGACADEVENVATPDVPEVGEKTPIELSVGGVDSQEPAATRAVITDGIGKTMSLFEKNANIFMVMESEYGTQDFNDPDSPHKLKYTITRGDVNKDQKTTIDETEVNIVSFDSKNQRYWDDAHARSSQLSIWAYAQIGKENWKTCTFQKRADGTGWDAFSDEEVNTDASRGWTSDDSYYPGIKHWRASIYNDNSQNGTTLMCQDMLFSNNLCNYNTDSEHPDETKDHRLKFDFTSRKFPSGEKTLMKFYHAMSKITIKIKADESFTATETSGDFSFEKNADGTYKENVKLIGFNNDGVFNIKTGQFEHVWTSSDSKPNDIPLIYLKSVTPGAEDGVYYTLEALAIPNIHDFRKTYSLTDPFSRFVKGAKDLSTDVMMEFSIDHNKYQITSDLLYDALTTSSDEPVTNATKKTDNGDYIPLEAGKNYVFTFTIGKTKVKDITAVVAAWEDVNAETVTPSNARITLNLEEREGDDLKVITDKEDKFSLYRAANESTGTAVNDNFESYKWETGYNETGEIPVYGTDHWSTSWYWPNNKTFYHFRALCEAHGDAAKTAVSPIVSATTGDYLLLSHSETTDNTSYKDICWGAPMLDVTPGNDVSDADATKPLKWYYDPDTYGFDSDKDGKVSEALPEDTQHQIYKAIGPTEHQIKLILFHMMSDVTFKITTSGASDPDHVVFKDDDKVTKIELQKIYTQGNLYLGNGLVKGVFESGKTEKENYTFSAAPEPNASNEVIWSNYGAIPQDLTGVVLVITTADNNQYKVKMEDVLATSVSNNNIVNPYPQPQGSTKYQINRWYPGYKYTYTFKLTKKGITDLQATIVDWEVVEAGDDTVQIE